MIDQLGAWYWASKLRPI